VTGFEDTTGALPVIRSTGRLASEGKPSREPQAESSIMAAMAGVIRSGIARVMRMP
jgi:hypothetical protein